MSAYNTVTVTAVSTLIIADNCNRSEIIITNSSNTTDIFIGMDANVTAATGLPLYANQSTSHSRGFGTYLGKIYGITASGEADVRYWETTQ